jgi:hypothetical protein
MGTDGELYIRITQKSEQKANFQEVLIAVAKFQVATCCLPKTNLFLDLRPLPLRDKRCRSLVPPPSPHSTQNIDNKETAKLFPRKVLHSKELDVEILIRKELRQNASRS